METSTNQASVSLMVNGVVQSETCSSMRQHAQNLLPMTERLLASAGLSCSQLDGIVFGRGPGSFTGVRIACSVAKGLAYAHDLPMFPVSSLAAIAYAAFHDRPETDREVAILAVIDARMQELYWGCFTKQVCEVTEYVTAPKAITYDDALPCILAGVGFEPYLAELSPQIQKVRPVTVFPHAASMVRLVEGGYIRSVNAAEALPTYVRNQVTQGGEKRG